MAGGIIHILEPVQIQEQHGHPVMVAPGIGQRMRQALVQLVPVGQAGQRIVRSHVMQLPLGFPDFGGIGKRNQYRGYQFLVAVEDGHHIDQQPGDRAVAQFHSYRQVHDRRAGPEHQGCRVVSQLHFRTVFVDDALEIAVAASG